MQSICKRLNNNRRRPTTSAYVFDQLESRILLSVTLPPAASPTNPVTIDLLALYTPAAEAAAGGAAAIAQHIQDDLIDANNVFANSQIYVTLHLAAAQPIAYYGDNDIVEDDLADLQAGRGDFAGVPALRDSTNADVVTLYTAPNNPDVGGIGYIMEDPATNYDNAPWAYNVVVMPPDGPRYGLVHEVAHNLGAGHDAQTDPQGGSYPFSFGYRFVGNDGHTYRDVEAYNPGTVIPYLSNPNLTYAGHAIGTAGANNALTLNLNAPLVAAYRGPRSGIAVTYDDSMYGPLPITDAQTAQVGFGIVDQYAPAPSLTFTIHNTGASNLSTADLCVPAGFLITKPPAPLIAPGASDTFTVALDTSTAGKKSGNISFRTNAPGSTLFNFPALAVVNAPPPPIGDLAPYTPAGWSAPVSTATAPGATTDSPVIYWDQNVYLNWAERNAMTDSTIPANFMTSLWIDGQFKDYWETRPADINGSPYLQVTDYNLGKLSPGQHQIMLIVDSTGTVAEPDETNNTFTKTITVTPRADRIAPKAATRLPAITRPSKAPYRFSVTYTDNVALKLATLSNGDILVTGPSGYRKYATRGAASLITNGSPVSVSYSIPAPGKIWDAADNGTYRVYLQPRQVSDVSRNYAAASLLGYIRVSISRKLSIPRKRSRKAPLAAVAAPAQPVFDRLNFPTSPFSSRTLLGDWTAKRRPDFFVDPLPA